MRVYGAKGCESHFQFEIAENNDLALKSSDSVPVTYRISQSWRLSRRIAAFS